MPLTLLSRIYSEYLEPPESESRRTRAIPNPCDPGDQVARSDLAVVRVGAGIDRGVVVEERSRRLGLIGADHDEYPTLSVDRDGPTLDGVDDFCVDAVGSQERFGHLCLTAVGVCRHRLGLGVRVGELFGHARGYPPLVAVKRVDARLTTAPRRRRILPLDGCETLVRMTALNDQELLQLAIEQALIGRSEGGIPIGAVLAVGGEVLGAGHNQRVQMGSAIRHGETDALENAGRLPAATYARATMYTTLSPCHMCTGAILLYGIKRVVIGENRTFMGAEDLLRQHGVEVINLDSARCVAMMNEFIAEHPSLWNEDIGEPDA